MELIHLGLGAFHRAHQAWYTQQAGGASIWAFTGRRPDAARILGAQGCRYTLVERAADGDSGTDMSVITRASAGDDHGAWTAAWTQPELVAVTLTITEKGYLGTGPDTAVGRLAAGLAARRRADLGPLAILSCDNLTGNGERTRTTVLGAAEQLDPALGTWVADSVTFPSTMVDRITPATTDTDLATVRDLVGWDDRSPVITEPFTEWVIAGAFPSGRPAWENAGAQLVPDVEPYEQRKLWLLNASHSLLAYYGLLRGHTTVAEAMADPVCEAVVVQLWSEAAAVLPFDATTIDAATAALRERYANARISHRLTQIASDGSQKLGPRVLAVHTARRAAGLPVGEGDATALAAWVLHLTGDRSLITDPQAEGLVEELASTPDAGDRVRLALAALDQGAVDDHDLVSTVTSTVRALERNDQR